MRLLTVLLTLSCSVPLQHAIVMSPAVKTLKTKPMSLFCFGWTHGDKEQLLFGEAVSDLAGCDDFRYFTQTGANITAHPKLVHVDIVTPVGPKTNMIGKIPSWSHIFNIPNIGAHDWFIDVEVDHYVRPKYAKQAIDQYVEALRKTSPEKAEGPLLIAFGNAFAFNRLLVKEMKRQWNYLGKQLPKTTAVGAGCPNWGNWAHFPQCPQDLLYPVMVQAKMEPPVTMLGRAGCNQESPPFRVGCWSPPAGVTWDEALPKIAALTGNQVDITNFHDAKFKSIMLQDSSFQPEDENDFLHRLKLLDSHVKNSTDGGRFSFLPQGNFKHQSRVEEVLQRMMDDAKVRIKPGQIPDRGIPIIHGVKLPKLHQDLRKSLPDAR